MRATPPELAALARHHRRVRHARRGKFLLLPFDRDGATERVLAANPMLAGRFWLLDDGKPKVRARTGLRLRFTDGGELRYVDREMLGKLYLVAPDALDSIPGWTEMGPDADDPALTLEAFRQRIRRHPGELKSLLRNPTLRGRHRQRLQRRDPVGGEAGAVAPPQHAQPGRGRRPLPRACAACWPMPPSGCATSCRRTSRPQHREFLKVHLRGGEPCPRCGRQLRQIGGDEATTFCRTCQPPF